MKNVIVVIEDNDIETVECWGALTKICESKGLPYRQIKEEDFPFTHENLRFIKVPYRKV